MFSTVLLSRGTKYGPSYVPRIFYCGLASMLGALTAHLLPGVECLLLNVVSKQSPKSVFVTYTLVIHLDLA